MHTFSSAGPRVWTVQQTQDVQEGTLARPRRAANGHEVALAHVEVDAIQHLDGASTKLEALGDAPHHQEYVVGFGHSYLRQRTGSITDALSAATAPAIIAMTTVPPQINITWPGSRIVGMVWNR